MGPGAVLPVAVRLAHQGHAVPRLVNLTVGYMKEQGKEREISVQTFSVLEVETILKPSVSLRLNRREKTCVANDPLIFASPSGLEM